MKVTPGAYKLSLMMEICDDILPSSIKLIKRVKIHVNTDDEISQEDDISIDPTIPNRPFFREKEKDNVKDDDSESLPIESNENVAIEIADKQYNDPTIPNRVVLDTEAEEEKPLMAVIETNQEEQEEKKSDEETDIQFDGSGNQIKGDENV